VWGEDGKPVKPPPKPKPKPKPRKIPPKKNPSKIAHTDKKFTEWAEKNGVTK
jgi:hypothetical protein